jgi:hypothetical protein
MRYGDSPEIGLRGRNKAGRYRRGDIGGRTKEEVRFRSRADFARKTAFNGGARRSRQNNQALEFPARAIISAFSFIRRRGLIHDYTQESLGPDNSLLLGLGESVASPPNRVGLSGVECGNVVPDSSQIIAG